MTVDVTFGGGSLPSWWTFGPGGAAAQTHDSGAAPTLFCMNARFADV